MKHLILLIALLSIGTIYAATLAPTPTPEFWIIEAQGKVVSTELTAAKTADISFSKTLLSCAKLSIWSMFAADKRSAVLVITVPGDKYEKLGDILKERQE